MESVVIVIFFIGYLLIALEHPIRINKAASALLTGLLCWTLFSLTEVPDHEAFLKVIKGDLAHHLSDISGILFFLLGAMTIVELIDAHHGFKLITNVISTRNPRKLLWVIGWITFFLSALLDNLTTTIVMISLMRKLIEDKNQKLLFAGLIVIAANAGGAWSPIGDVTTTMLWIDGRVSTGGLITNLFIPSVFCLLVPLLLITLKMPKTQTGSIDYQAPDQTYARGGKIMLGAGVGALLFVPIFKSITHLPPYMGMLLGLGVVWLVSEFINPDLDEQEKKQYTVAGALSRVDTASVLFFFGILMAVGALESMHVLEHFSLLLEKNIGNQSLTVTLIGIISSVVDNVPLVAATIGMYTVDQFPMDSPLWSYLAYCAGTGGSLLIIGSAAGVAAMGIEKIDFIWYMKHISWLAFVGYIAGALVYLIL